MSVNEKMTTIADKIRTHTGDSHLLTLDGIADGVDTVFIRGYMDGEDEGKRVGYNLGYEAGTADEIAKCVAKHFVTTVIGNGTTSLSFKVPFAPDALVICCFDPRIRGAKNNLLTWTADLRSFGIMSCRYTLMSAAGGSFTAGTVGTSSVYTHCPQAEDGTITIQNIAGSGGKCIFASDCLYIVVAVKHTDQSDKERITAFVNGLTGSGTAEMAKTKVDAAFTAEEWAALIATKPDWTFSVM